MNGSPYGHIPLSAWPNIIAIRYAVALGCAVLLAMLSDEVHRLGRHPAAIVWVASFMLFYLVFMDAAHTRQVVLAPLRAMSLPPVYIGVTVFLTHDMGLVVIGLVETVVFACAAYVIARVATWFQERRRAR